MSFLESYLKVADYPGHMDWDWGGGWWVVMVVAMTLFWGLVIFWLVREVVPRRSRDGAPQSEDPRQILDRRLAEGLISPDEYRERVDILAGRQSSSNDPE